MSSLATRLESLTTRRNDKPDRGALANLRRGLSETTRHYAWPVLARLGFAVDDEEAVWVAALYAEHPMHTSEKRSLGATWLRVSRQRKPGGGDETDSYHMRFRRLISCDRKELPEHLLAVIRLAASARPPVPVNYDELYFDIKNWERVKLKWAKDFHEVQLEEADTPEAS